jgi:mRNA-degrading endonuclease RelE of RelBE toxin-antitoxin system
MPENEKSHYELIFPSIKSYSITNHFKRDLKHSKDMLAIVMHVIDSDYAKFEELHKFEKKIGNTAVFRAKIKGIHILYCITEEKELLFLRAISNFNEYEKQLNMGKNLSQMIEANISFK